MRRNGLVKGVKGIAAGQVVTVIGNDGKRGAAAYARPFGLEKIVQRIVTDARLHEVDLGFGVQTVRAFAIPKLAELPGKAGKLRHLDLRGEAMVRGAQAEVVTIKRQDQTPRLVNFSPNGVFIQHRDGALKTAPVGLRLNAPLPDIELISGAQAGDIVGRIRGVNRLRRENPGIAEPHVDGVAMQIKRRAQLAGLEAPAF